MKPCKDCGSTTRKQTWKDGTTIAGPRCQPCARVVKKQRSAASHARRCKSTYGITGEEYEALKAFQGGHCAICQRAYGKTKRLAVDHNHATDEVRGLLCSVCNSFLATIRDDPDAGYRLAQYLTTPPFRMMKIRQDAVFINYTQSTSGDMRMFDWYTDDAT